jgi:hypothetical protein
MLLLTAVCSYAQTPAAFPLTKSCGSGSAAVATLGVSDHVKVRYSFMGDAGTCYAVTASIDGKSVDGYLIGAAHPDIAAFEQEVRTHAALIPQPPPPPPPAPAATAPAATSATPVVAKEVTPPAAPPLSFAGFRAVDINGDRIDLSNRHAANVVVYFWSARTPRGIQNVEPMDAVYDNYHSRGVDVVGIASAANSAQLTDVCRNHEIVWPQVLDSGGIASRYHVDPARPFLVLDQSRNVIASAPSVAALGPILEQITKNRRARQQ